MNSKIFIQSVFLDKTIKPFRSDHDVIAVSLPDFLDIVVKDKRYKEDANLVALAALIDEAIKEQKYVIHYGV